MHFEDWEPIYLDILEDFGFSRERDEEAALLLSDLLEDRKPDEILNEAKELICGKVVVICGNAPCLGRELQDLNDIEAEYMAADGAVAILMKEGKLPGIIVTDLDGPIDAIKDANRLGSIVVIHAHGDNMDALRLYASHLKRIIGTTQSKPLKNVYNFGGFSDGDRCIFLARYLKAQTIKLIGFDFDDPCVTPRKKKKLNWARRLTKLAMSSEFASSDQF